MTMHNSLAVAQAAAMGFKRVVLARELTLSELASICRQSKVELEVFVHGALCFCFSGLCLFSSFLGGRAATRGRCTQPCRRLYQYGQESGHILSPSDLSGLELLPQLEALGITAVKLEGRMKSGEYVGRVVQAYRQVLDAAPSARIQALAEARELLARTYSRRTTAGFFLGARPQELLAPQDTGNIGLFLGKLTRVEQTRGVLRLLEPLSTGDRLRLHGTASGDRQAFTLKELFWQGKQLPVADAGDVVEVNLPEPAQAGDLLYKVGETTPGGSRSEKKWRETLFNLAKPTFVPSFLARNLANLLKPGKFFGPGKTRPGPPLVYVRVRSVTEALEVKRQGLWHLLVELTEENFNDYLRNLRSVKKLKGLIWQLPTIMFEGSLAFHRQAVATLLDGGWRYFMVGNLGHLHLLQEAQAAVGLPVGKKSRRVGHAGPEESAPDEKNPAPLPPKLTLYSDYTLHCLNSLAFQALHELGVDYLTLSVEADNETLNVLFKNVPSSRLLAYVYGHLPLMISRASLPAGKKALRLTSPRGEQFRLLTQGDLTYLISKFPYLMQKPLGELLPQGLARVIVDLNNSGLPVSEVGSIVRRLLSGPPITGGLPLNYYRGLE
jgi:putative protease